MSVDLLATRSASTKNASYESGRSDVASAWIIHSNYLTPLKLLGIRLVVDDGGSFANCELVHRLEALSHRRLEATHAIDLLVT